MGERERKTNVKIIEKMEVKCLMLVHLDKEQYGVICTISIVATNL